jgi:hypothetical protein
MKRVSDALHNSVFISAGPWECDELRYRVVKRPVLAMKGLLRPASNAVPAPGFRSPAPG